MRRVLFAVALALMALAPMGRGAPVSGTAWSYAPVAAGTVRDGVVTEPGCQQFTKKYAAGARACVIVIGERKTSGDEEEPAPPIDYEVKVYDEKNQLVAQDRGQGAAKDFVAVMWYPSRQQEYRIEVCAFGREPTKCSIAFK